MIAQLLDIVLRLDHHLMQVALEYGVWVYGLLFLIIFCETGLVVTPFLPGDSLLFVAGAVAAAGAMDIHAMVLLLIAAAFLGNMLNFQVGRFVGPQVFRKRESWFLKPEYLERTHAFYERHGGKTIVLSRFIPILRTYAPFVAGIGQMSHRRFAMFNLTGGILWVASLSYLGYFFGNLPVVKQNLGWVIIAIVVLSISPAIVEYLRQRLRSA